MAKSVRGVLSQKLVPSADGFGRAAAIEIMLSGPTVSKLIEEGRSGSLHQAIQEDRFYGMQTMNEALIKLVQDGRVTEDDAISHSPNPIELKQMLRRVDAGNAPTIQISSVGAPYAGTASGSPNAQSLLNRR
jgi:Tfp pilus assembly pilus retraction ATPase PilT